LFLRYNQANFVSLCGKSLDKTLLFVYKGIYLYFAEVDMLFRICKKSICVIVVLVIAASCSDDPEGKAARELRKSASNALSADTNEKVLKSLDLALKKSSARAGKSANPVRMSIVNITLDSAGEIIDKLDDCDSQAGEELAKISLTIHNASELQIEYENLKEVISAADKQINILQKQIDGDKQVPGVKKRLEAAAANVTKLTEQKNSFLDQAKEAQKRADDIQQQSDKKLKLSETVSGEEWDMLHKQGYDLLYSKKEFVLKAQEAMDSADLIQRQIDIALPLDKKLRGDMALLKSQVETVKNSPQKAKNSSRLRELKKQIDSASKEVTIIIGKLESLCRQYDQMIQQVTAVLEDGEKRSKKISGSLRTTANARIADSVFTKAVAEARAVGFNEHIMLRLKSIASSSETGKARLNNTAGKCRTTMTACAKKAMEGFTLAAEDYLKLAEKSRGDSTLDCAMTKNAMLALHEKILVAEAVEEYDAAEDALAAAEKLTEKIQKCDPDFQSTALWQFTQGRSRYTPAMALDSETYYQGLKKQLQEWKKLADDARKTEAARLLAELDEMTNPRDPEAFARIIGPERKLLENELTKKEEVISETTETTEDWDTGVGDPNF